METRHFLNESDKDREMFIRKFKIKRYLFYLSKCVFAPNNQVDQVCKTNQIKSLIETNGGRCALVGFRKTLQLHPRFFILPVHIGIWVF